MPFGSRTGTIRTEERAISTYDAVIVDVRLPPGADNVWRDHYRNAGSDKVGAQLGLRLLHWLLSGDTEVFPNTPPSWIDPGRVGVFAQARDVDHVAGDVLEELLALLGIGKGVLKCGLGNA